jgi:hypothetical protein
MLNKQQNEYLIKAVDLLHEADRLMQLGMNNEGTDGEECYAIHCAIECAADDILDYIQENNPDIDREVQSETFSR